MYSGFRRGIQQDLCFLLGGLGGDLGTFVIVVDQTAYSVRSDVPQPAAESVTRKDRVNFILRPKLYNILRGTVF